MKILLVDDSADDRLIFKERSKGHDIHEAGSYQEGIGMIKRNYYDVVVWDYRFNGEEKTGADGVMFTKVMSPQTRTIIQTGLPDDIHSELADMVASKDESIEHVLKTIPPPISHEKKEPVLSVIGGYSKDILVMLTIMGVILTAGYKAFGEKLVEDTVRDSTTHKLAEQNKKEIDTLKNVVVQMQKDDEETHWNSLETKLIVRETASESVRAKVAEQMKEIKKQLRKEDKE